MKERSMTDEFIDGGGYYDHSFEHVHAPDGIHDYVEPNGVRENSNGTALAIIILALLFFAMCFLAGLMWWVDA